MLGRRTLLGVSALGSLLESNVSAAGEPQASKDTDAAIDNVRKAISDLRDAVSRQVDFWELTPLQTPIRAFLKSNNKFPDNLEVGIDIWYQVYDWHIRHLQTPTLGRTADNRYTIMYMGTSIVMRTDYLQNYVGIPYDNR